MIWGYCLPQRHIISLEVIVGKYGSTRCYRQAVENLHRFPQVAYVCREARRVALKRQAQRKSYTIVDRERENELDDSWGVGMTVPFDPMRDVIFMNILPEQERLRFDLAREAPHLAALLPDRNVEVCVSSWLTNRYPDVLRDLSRQKRKTFYVALGRQFVIHMTREKALQRRLFGVGADETTVMIKVAESEEIEPYELAYNMTRRGGGHEDMGTQIARSFTASTWVGRYSNRSFEALANMAEEQIQSAWAKLHEPGVNGQEPASDRQNEDQAEKAVLGDDRKKARRMPVPIPVVLFRLCTDCRHK